jgi:hypothetical protein
MKKMKKQSNKKSIKNIIEFFPELNLVLSSTSKPRIDTITIFTQVLPSKTSLKLYQWIRFLKAKNNKTNTGKYNNFKKSSQVVFYIIRKYSAYNRYCRGKKPSPRILPVITFNRHIFYSGYNSRQRRSELESIFFELKK